MMTPEERDKLFAIRCRTKRGRPTSYEELKFCEAMLKKDREGYAAMTTEVFNETKKDFDFS